MIITERKEVPDVEYRKDGKALEIYREQNPINPRKSEYLGRMICAHKRYDLGDKQLDTSRFDGWDEIEKHLYEDENAEVVLPLYLYDHSQLSIKVGSFAGQLPQYHARFDSGQVGFIYTTEEWVENYGLEDKSEEEIREHLKREVKYYNKYLEGKVYRFVLKEDGEVVDSCGGFIGSISEVTDWIVETVGIDSIEDWEKETPR